MNPRSILNFIKNKISKLFQNSIFSLPDGSPQHGRPGHAGPHQLLPHDLPQPHGGRLHDARRGLLPLPHERNDGAPWFTAPPYAFRVSHCHVIKVVGMYNVFRLP